MRTLVAAAVVSLALALASAAGASPPSTEATLVKLVLQPSQVGPGYVLQQRSDGQCVHACVTLELCGFTFASEGKRTGRLQVNYSRNGRIELSNEVVSYQPGWAARAIVELGHAVDSCPTKPVKSTVAGVGPVSYRITRLHDGHLLPGYLALELAVSGSTNGKRFSGTTIGIYQVHGNYLSGVYGSIANGTPAAADEALALHAAEASAANLKAAVKNG